MTTPWHSLYFPSADAETIAQALQDSLAALGYHLYNPFGSLPGQAYSQAVRLFVAPAAQGWVRVIGEPDRRQVAGLSQGRLCLYAALSGKDAQFEVYQDGTEVQAETALLPYFRAGMTVDDLARALHGAEMRIAEADDATSLPVAALPEDVKGLAEHVDMQQAQKLFTRLSSQLAKKAGQEGDTADAARQLVSGGDRPDWNSAGGQRLRAIMACLNVPEHWREPDFVTLRDAYQVHERRRRKPDALLYPGDAEAMERVPDALAYRPVYGGMLARP